MTLNELKRIVDLTAEKFSGETEVLVSVTYTDHPKKVEKAGVCFDTKTNAFGFYLDI